MPGAVDWGSLTLPGAFLVGAVGATIATIRVMAIVMRYFEGGGHRRPTRRRPPDDAE